MTERENGRQDERETGAELNLRQEIVHAGRRGARLTDVGGLRERGDPFAVFPRKPLRPRSPLSSETIAVTDSCAAATVIIFFRYQFLSDVIFGVSKMNLFYFSFSSVIRHVFAITPHPSTSLYNSQVPDINFPHKKNKNNNITIIIIFFFNIRAFRDL